MKVSQCAADEDVESGSDALGWAETTMGKFSPAVFNSAVKTKFSQWIFCFLSPQKCFVGVRPQTEIMTHIVVVS